MKRGFWSGFGLESYQGRGRSLGGRGRSGGICRRSSGRKTGGERQGQLSPLLAHLKLLLAFSLLKPWRGCSHIPPGRQMKEPQRAQDRLWWTKEACQPVTCSVACCLGRPGWYQRDEGRSFS